MAKKLQGRTSTFNQKAGMVDLGKMILKTRVLECLKGFENMIALYKKSIYIYIEREGSRILTDSSEIA